ncbi:MAG: biotin--[acetyl-CoA-carboxylase] ligase, partial [Actinocatenispora sp.]
LGRTVRVELPDGEVLAGEATDVDADGRLVVTPEGGTPVPLAAGDVTHVR